mmetsp:Transcript_44367/g.102487  ORF Transcript_44367/g.102487 Transcript_44367/m.102487 type:complete len:319 (-) Transcript_44367:285-1241(-)
MTAYLAQALAPVFRALGAQSQDVDPKTAIARQPRPSMAEALPAMEYPAPLLVRNSFINAETNQPLSLDFEPEKSRHTPSSNRSTSVGSSSASPASSNEASPASTPESTPERLQPSAVPRPLPVKNTFINFDIGRPLSLEGFIDERTLRSCPASVIDEPPADEPAVVEGATVGVPWPLGIPPPPAEPPVLLPTALLNDTAPPAQAPVLPEAVTPMGLPSVGSAKHLHRRGKCRPCAHVHSAEGCKNGAECTFCHLCPPGELKRRHKEKRQQKAQRLARRRAETAVAEATGADAAGEEAAGEEAGGEEAVGEEGADSGEA